MLTHKLTYLQQRCFYHAGKERRKFASFTIKERQSLPVVNHYLIVFNAYAVFLDLKNGAESWRKLKAVLQVYPQTAVQLCIVHLIRNSLNYVSWKMRKQIAADLKQIYQSATVDEAEQRLAEFETQWNGTYPPIAQIGGVTGAVSFRSSITHRRYAASFTPPTPSSR